MVPEQLLAEIADILDVGIAQAELPDKDQQLVIYQKEYWD